ncbi:hypothetical protein PSHT_13148 [Puccinia striiformis]|uniref:Uncharacterized protein n=1 Tax=Puccinia striiformis TaxID=27350 RepID=A0A2S4USG3_9BASI|nr:hypothetical protein PSHT_13148 [Puccinia striiformis]
MTTSSHPLRPYYQPEQQQDSHSHWLRPTATATNSTSTLRHLMTSSSAPTRASSSSSGAAGYSLRNRTSVIPDYDIDLRGPSTDTANLSLILRGYLSAGLMAFTSAAMVMPFEVGKTLLQVQWIPAQALHDPSIHIHPPSQDPQPKIIWKKKKTKRMMMITWILIKPTLRPSIGSTISKRTISGGSTNPTTGRKRVEEEVWPEWVLPVVIERGVSDMMRAISRWRGEGFLGLWKGQLTAFIIDTISSKLQPILLSGLFLLVGSYTITGLLLAPLDLIRTRLIVQSSQLRHRKYSGPINAFQQIVKDEGGIRNLFLDSTLLFPALLDNLVRPLIHLATPLIIDRVIGIDRVQEPLRFGLAEFGISSLGLLLVLPLETVRKRLQLQSRHPSPQLLKACVRLRPVPYNGIVEGFYRIITEEKHGFWGLFRGLNVGITANFVVFILSLIGSNNYNSSVSPISSTSVSAGNGGWAEV